MAMHCAFPYIDILRYGGKLPGQPDGTAVFCCSDADVVMVFKAEILQSFITSIYSIVDGIFISNFAGKTSFAAINLIMPVIMLFGSSGFLFGTGGSAIVASLLGEGKKDKAKNFFFINLFCNCCQFNFVQYCLRSYEKISQLIWCRRSAFGRYNNLWYYVRILYPAGSCIFYYQK